MKITRSQLKQIIKEEISKALTEGKLPSYSDLPDEKKGLALDAVQNYFKEIKDYELGPNYERTIEQIVHSAAFNADPNRKIGKDILNILVQKYPEEVKVRGKSPKFPGVKHHPHWTPLSWGVGKELSNLLDAIRNIPKEEKVDLDILKRLREDWVEYAKELGVALGQSQSY